jgi:hypothetical protein
MNYFFKPRMIRLFDFISQVSITKEGSVIISFGFIYYILGDHGMIIHEVLDSIKEVPSYLDHLFILLIYGSFIEVVDNLKLLNISKQNFSDLNQFRTLEKGKI